MIYAQFHAAKAESENPVSAVFIDVHGIFNLSKDCKEIFFRRERYASSKKKESERGLRPDSVWSE